MTDENSADGGSSAGRELAEPDVADHEKRPFHFVRALLLTMPLAILVGTVVAPPDPFAQLLLIGATLIGGLPITMRLVAGRRYGPRQLAVFFGVILVVTLAGLQALAAVGSGPLPSVLARFLVVAVALGAGDAVVFRVLESGAN